MKYSERAKRLNKHRERHGPGSYQAVERLCGQRAMEGGWTSRWMSVRELLAIEERVFKRCYETCISEEEALPCGPFQCGGCRWFACFFTDFGICGCSDSPHDCRIVFEHGGCREHSFYKQVMAERAKGVLAE